MTSRSSTTNNNIDELQSCFEQWRVSRRERAWIPDDQWAAAVTRREATVWAGRLQHCVSAEK